MPTLSGDAPAFQRASDQSLFILLGGKITLEAHQRVRKLLLLLAAEPLPGIVNLHPAYCSLLVKFDPQRWRHPDLEAALQPLLARLDQVALPESRQIEIPVCYGGAHGPDLADVSALHKLAPQQVIDLHSAPTYLVYFLGFVPGFAYLGELPAALATPRLSTPRRAVPPGSVGIAGTQTGVYPVSTPGGWRLIGRTPLSLFRPRESGLSLLSIGDRVRFRPVSPDEFARIETRA